MQPRLAAPDKATRIGAVTDLPLNEIADAMQISSGLHYVSTEYGSVPSISYDDAAMNELAALAYTVFGNGQGFSSGYGSDTSAATSFRGGDVLFYVGTFRDAETLASAESDWGVLPLPVLFGADFGNNRNVSELGGPWSLRAATRSVKIPLPCSRHFRSHPLV